MTEREEYEMWLRENFNSARVPRIAAEFGFEAWQAGRQLIIAASGAPVEIHSIKDGE